MIRIRIRQPAFHPSAGMDLLHLDDRVFGIRRFCPTQTLNALTNFSTDTLTLSLPGEDQHAATIDLLSGKRFHSGAVTLAAYETAWLTPKK